MHNNNKENCIYICIWIPFYFSFISICNKYIETVMQSILNLQLNKISPYVGKLIPRKTHTHTHTHRATRTLPWTWTWLQFTFFRLANAQLCLNIYSFTCPPLMTTTMTAKYPFIMPKSGRSACKCISLLLLLLLLFMLLGHFCCLIDRSLLHDLGNIHIYMYIFIVYAVYDLNARHTLCKLRKWKWNVMSSQELPVPLPHLTLYPSYSLLLSPLSLFSLPSHLLLVIYVC